VVILTRGKDEKYFDYILEVLNYGGEVAIAVKRHDLIDHLRDRIAIPDSLVKRYERALEILS
jgi:late competence protein required for DNA uptake (superfamily II DNA/RNA helicase)